MHEGFPMVKRYAFVIDPSEDYLKWVKDCLNDNTLTLKDLRAESTVYLTPQFDCDPEEWLKRNYRGIFEEELLGWCTDKSKWPADLSFQVFKRFFEIRFCSIVFDINDSSS